MNALTFHQVCLMSLPHPGQLRIRVTIRLLSTIRHVPNSTVHHHHYNDNVMMMMMKKNRHLLLPLQQLVHLVRIHLQQQQQQQHRIQSCMARQSKKQPTWTSCVEEAHRFVITRATDTFVSLSAMPRKNIYGPLGPTNNGGYTTSLVSFTTGVVGS